MYKPDGSSGVATNGYQFVLSQCSISTT